ncbi:MAG: hypothetical protein LBS19_14225 [Clostridiales bacterium]|jgi:hypothetical protein|nr:hypothetical protein [Clostridiales bacterium]
MPFDNIFKFISREEREKQSRAYQKRIFPLGLGQRDAVLAALRPLINRKIDDSGILYIFIAAKQEYLDDDQDPDTVVRKFLNKRKDLNENEKDCVAALIRLDADITGLEDYPSSEEISVKIRKEAGNGSYEIIG